MNTNIDEVLENLSKLIDNLKFENKIYGQLVQDIIDLNESGEGHFEAVYKLSMEIIMKIYKQRKWLDEFENKYRLLTPSERIQEFMNRYRNNDTK
jgi:hypothetical protein